MPDSKHTLTCTDWIRHNIATWECSNCKITLKHEPEMWGVISPIIRFCQYCGIKFQYYKQYPEVIENFSIDLHVNRAMCPHCGLIYYISNTAQHQLECPGIAR